MFKAALFITAKNWKRSSSSSTGEWINNVVHSYNDILVNKKKLAIKAQKEIVLTILLSERSWSEGATYCMNLNYMTFWKR